MLSKLYLTYNIGYNCRNFKAEPKNDDDDAGEEHIVAELLLDEALDVISSDAGETAAIEHYVDPSASKSRVGNTVYSGNQLVGTIAYLLHWKPESFSAQCRVHDSCVVTAPMESMDEALLENWLLIANRYPTAEQHMDAKPPGSYNRRNRKPWAETVQRPEICTGCLQALLAVIVDLLGLASTCTLHALELKGEERCLHSTFCSLHYQLL